METRYVITYRDTHKGNRNQTWTATFYAESFAQAYNMAMRNLEEAGQTYYEVTAIEKEWSP